MGDTLAHFWADSRNKESSSDGNERPRQANKVATRDAMDSTSSNNNNDDYEYDDSESLLSLSDPFPGYLFFSHLFSAMAVDGQKQDISSLYETSQKSPSSVISSVISDVIGQTHTAQTFTKSITAEEDDNILASEQVFKKNVQPHTTQSFFVDDLQALNVLERRAVLKEEVKGLTGKILDAAAKSGMFVDQ